MPELLTQQAVLTGLKGPFLLQCLLLVAKVSA